MVSKRSPLWNEVKAISHPVVPERISLFLVGRTVTPLNPIALSGVVKGVNKYRDNAGWHGGIV